MAASIAVNGANCVLSYKNGNQVVTAQVRVKELSHVFGVVSTESQSAQRRAFYPHRRAQGQFMIIVDCIHYKEFKQLMNWLTDYGNALLSVSQSNDQPPTMTVSLPSRKFVRQGVLTTGIDDHDQTGSMVLSPQLTFVSVSDPNDSLSSILSTSQVSNFTEASVDSANSAWFYPSTGNSVDANIYDIPSSISNSLDNTVVNSIVVNGKVKGF